MFVNPNEASSSSDSVESIPDVYERKKTMSKLSDVQQNELLKLKR